MRGGGKELAANRDGAPEARPGAKSVLTRCPRAVRESAGSEISRLNVLNCRKGFVSSRGGSSGLTRSVEMINDKKEKGREREREGIGSTETERRTREKEEI